MNSNSCCCSFYLYLLPKVLEECIISPVFFRLLYYAFFIVLTTYSIGFAFFANNEKMTEFLPVYSFTSLDGGFECLNSRDRREQLLQYNLDQILTVSKFRFSGSLNLSDTEYKQLLDDFFSSFANLSSLNVSGTPAIPMQVSSENLGVGVMSMEFFDRLEEVGIIGPGGRIKGCFDEVFDGITVSDLLREFLLNGDSENASVYSGSERMELIFQLFRIFVVGGSLCQPDPTIERYLDITKSFYKELVTVYRDAKTESVQVAGRAYKISKIQGLNIFDHEDSPHNSMIVVIDPMKHIVTVVRCSFKPFW